MMKYITNALPLIVLLVLVFLVYRSYSITPSKPVTTPVEAQPQKLTVHTDTFTIDITYPTIPGTGEAIDAANALLRAQIDAKVESFKKDASETNIPTTDLPADVINSVAGSPTIEEQNTRYVAIYMGIEWYARGAAHPYHTIDTYVYDYQEGKLVTIPSGFFKASSSYLQLLSQLSRQDLKAQSDTGDMGYVYDETMVNDGTTPTTDNFSEMLPSKDGLVIYFGEYQVAPYVAGPQQVTIPYTKLKDIIDPHGVLGMYIK